ncbi:MAG: autotransporter outer membrane beta-barrel domain-containing protein, partial [Patescibacteria group bacterium]|nr:autotransporter outer membrane beta-barrel domain-containing protein [Patescibacteria group bacterium]
GLERQLSDEVTAGLAIAHANTSISFRDRLGSGTLNVLRVGPYASFFRDDWFADAAISYGYHDNSVRRNVAVGSIAETAEGRYHANDVSLYFGLGRLWGTPDRVLSPVASIQYIYFDQPGFVESNAPAAGLTLGNNSADSLRSRVGLESTRWASWRCFQVRGDWSAGWAHEYLADDALAAQFTGGTTTFRTQRLAGYRDSAYVTAGLALNRGSRLSLFSRYTGELSNDGSFHAIDLGLTAAY